MSKIRLNDIIKESVVDGPGFRYTMFLQGCTFNCKNCHNPSTHDLDGGYLKDLDELIQDINSSTFIDGITISGGEPFLQVDKCLYITKNINKHLNIICYTGYTFEELLKMSEKNNLIISFLEGINYLVDGKYIDDLRTLEKRFVGSKNQRIIDTKKSLKENKVILANL